MFQTQIRPFLSLPDYDLSEFDRVAVTIRDTILEERDCQLLMKRSDQDLGWAVKEPRHHADYIEVKDTPACWRTRSMTIDIEAKAKECAVIALQAAWPCGEGPKTRRGPRTRIVSPRAEGVR